MKLGPEPKLDKRKKPTSKNFDGDVIPERICNVIFILLIYGQFWAILYPNFWRIVCKTYIFINSNLLSYKKWKQNWEISKTAITLLLWIKVLLLPRNADVLQRDADINKIQRVLVLKGIFSETSYVCVPTYQISRF